MPKESNPQQKKSLSEKRSSLVEHYAANPIVSGVVVGVSSLVPVFGSFVTIIDGAIKQKGQKRIEENERVFRDVFSNDSTIY